MRTMFRTTSIVGVLVVVGCSKEAAEPVRVDPAKVSTAQSDSSPTREAKSAEVKRKAKAPRKFDDELGALDRRIASAKELAEKQRTSFMAQDRVAASYLERARLSGDYADYGHAEEWIAKAFAIDPKGKFGPFMSRASLNFTLHRLDRCDADFEKGQNGPHDNVTESGHELFAGNLALQRGDYAKALAHFKESRIQHESMSNLSALANYHWGVGDFDEAEKLFRKSMAMYHGATAEPLAWYHLQLGLMDLSRGRWEDALAHYRDAEAVLSGWWLVDEHIAEVTLLLGKKDEAKALYADIIERTSNPEFMDAMAGLLLEEGKADEAKVFVEKADARYRELMAKFPEAAYGHALDHYLEFGEDKAFVVDLAEKNHALRPNVDAKVLLAQAYLKAERAADAKRVIEEALATPWNTADLHATAAKVYRASGDAAKADEELAKAKAIDPHAEE
jgi:tetratricopeptide (TPR) repeat protein